MKSLTSANCDWSFLRMRTGYGVVSTEQG
jgi:hypothetical protein